MPVIDNDDIYDGSRKLHSTHLPKNFIDEDIVWDQNNNILIMAPADTSYSLNNPDYASDLNIVIKKYGEDSILTKCFKVAKTFGAESIFLMNIQHRSDFLEAIDIFTQYDFAYVIPIGIHLSDSFYDIANGGSKTSYYAYVLSKMPSRKETVFIATDKHASLYEDIDSFIDDMNEVENDFLNSGLNINKENLLFVGNNLSYTTYANLYLASAICSAAPADYPQIDFGDTVFDIDQFDMTGSWAYFKSHYLIDTSVENLSNEYSSGYPQKIFTISRIIKIIKRELDFSEFIGRQYTDYQRLQVEQKLEKYLEIMMNVCIWKYNILSVTAYDDPSHPATVVILAKFQVWPINCIESVQISKEVEIGV